jgi:PncC family amidohydrolase
MDDLVLVTEGRALAARLGQVLLAQGKTLALAESCTGGLTASLITDIAGSSAYFLGSAVTYSYEAKEQVLGVAHATLLAHGAVSPETAGEMARAARRLFGADLALSVTGIAGPGGATPEKPVGLVCIHLSAHDAEIDEQHVWPLDRVGNKMLSAHAVLTLAMRYLEGDPSTPSLPKGGRDSAQDGSDSMPGVEASAGHSRGPGSPAEPSSPDVSGGGYLPDFPSEAVAVELRLLPGGQVAPEAFTWRGRRYPVADVGRQWVEETGGAAWHCYLVRTPSGETFELRGDLARDRWIVGRAWRSKNET